MEQETFADVWDALADTPEEAANMKLRSDLMTRAQSAVGSWGVSPVMAAKRLGISQPRLNDLLRDRLAKFSLDALVLLAVRAGLSVSDSKPRPRLAVPDGRGVNYVSCRPILRLEPPRHRPGVQPPLGSAVPPRRAMNPGRILKGGRGRWRSRALSRNGQR